MAFYDNYVRLCGVHGYTPSSCADELGLDRSAVTRWKKGGKPSYVTLLRIAEFFKVDPNELAYADLHTQMGIQNDLMTSKIERQLIKAWRFADEDTRENVAFILRKTGFKYKVEEPSDGQHVPGDVKMMENE